MHNGSGLMISLLVTTVIVGILIYLFLVPHASESNLPNPSGQASKTAQSSVTETLLTQGQPPPTKLKNVRKAVEDAERKIFENADTLEHVQ